MFSVKTKNIHWPTFASSFSAVYRVSVPGGHPHRSILLFQASRHGHFLHIAFVRAKKKRKCLFLHIWFLNVKIHVQIHFTIASHKCGIIHTRFHMMEKKRSSIELSINMSKRLTGRKPVRNEVTSERGYCQIISVARATARVTAIIHKILYYSRGVHIWQTSWQKFRKVREKMTKIRLNI